MVEEFELTVPFVGTDDNISDFFTKPMHPKKFFVFRSLIMNEPAASLPLEIGSAALCMHVHPTLSRGGASEGRDVAYSTSYCNVLVTV